MALQVYPGAAAVAAYSQEGANTNPIRFAVDGRLGGVFERQYYLGNDVDSTHTGITIVPTPNPANDITSGEDGYSIKLYAGSTQPTEQEWNTIEPGNEIDMDDIPDNLTFVPFWVRIAIPKGAPVDTITNTFLTIDSVES